MTRTLAFAQADLMQRTEELRQSNESKAEAEMHLRAEYERQKARSLDLAARGRDLQASNVICATKECYMCDQAMLYVRSSDVICAIKRCYMCDRAMLYVRSRAKLAAMRDYGRVM